VLPVVGAKGLICVAGAFQGDIEPAPAAIVFGRLHADDSPPPIVLPVEFIGGRQEVFDKSLVAATASPPSPNALIRQNEYPAVFPPGGQFMDRAQRVHVGLPPV
jgi:hypothetical protein